MSDGSIDTADYGRESLSFGEPELMRRMAHTLGVDGLLGADAAARCNSCTDKADCHRWLDVAALAGAERAPSFCMNTELFAELTTEVPASL